MVHTQHVLLLQCKCAHALKAYRKFSLQAPEVAALRHDKCCWLKCLGAVLPHPHTPTRVQLKKGTGKGHRYLDDELDCLLQANVIFEILLQDVLCPLAVGTNSSGLPATIVATRVTLIQLEAICDIPATARRCLAKVVPYCSSCGPFRLGQPWVTKWCVLQQAPVLLMCKMQSNYTMLLTRHRCLPACVQQ